MPIFKLLTAIVLRSGRNAVFCLLASCLAWSAAAARDEYHLATGDVIEISVARIPELQRRVPINVDGSISFPLVGTVEVAGLSLSQAQAKLQGLLANNVFETAAPNRQNKAVVITPGEVTVTVAEYRPVYVDGDVSKPGEYPYRLPMTARQAIALSGGYDTLRFRMHDPFFDLADLKSEYETLWIEFAKERAHVWRVKSELGESKAPDNKPLAGVPLPDSEIAEIIRVETETRSANQTDQQKEKEFLRRAIEQASDQIGTLSQQQQEEEQGVKSDEDELQRDLDLSKRGMVISQRVTDARRAVLLSSTRKLQTDVELMQLKKQQDELKRKLEQLDDRRRIELLGELQEASAKLNAIFAKLKGVEDKMEYTGLLRSQLSNGEMGGPEIAIVRKSENGAQRLVANEDSELQPGDTIEVSLRRSASPVTTQ
jgi:polysaccharide biosynthesis/export protein